MARLVLIILVLVIGVIFASVQKTSTEKHDEVEMSLKEYLLGSFLDELPEINAKLPLQLDEDTVLLSIKYTENRVVSRYLLPNFTLRMDSDRLIKDRVIPALKLEACLDQSKRSLIEVDVEFLMIYQAPDGSEIFEILLNHGVCAEVQGSADFHRN